jgi:hypothetical protein
MSDDEQNIKTSRMIDALDCEVVDQEIEMLEEQDMEEEQDDPMIVATLESLDKMREYRERMALPLCEFLSEQNMIDFVNSTM